MAYFLFIDESGIDGHESPYEVLAGVAIEDCVLWNLVWELQAAEVHRFGRRYSAGTRELKGKKILKPKRIVWPNTPARSQKTIFLSWPRNASITAQRTFPSRTSRP